MSVLVQVEILTDQVYGKGAAVSVDREDRGWVIRCWDRKGVERLNTGLPLAKHDALGTMKRRLQRASFLRTEDTNE